MKEAGWEEGLGVGRRGDGMRGEGRGEDGRAVVVVVAIALKVAMVAVVLVVVVVESGGANPCESEDSGDCGVGGSGRNG